jgi:hypothetical protein
MRIFRLLVYFGVLAAVLGGFALGVLKFYGWEANPIQSGHRFIVLILPTLVVLGFAVGWIERFMLRSGALIGVFGGLMLWIHDRSPIGLSLKNLRLWHSIRNREEAKAEEGSGQKGGEYPSGYAEYMKGLTPLERTDFKSKNPFSQWMVADIVKKYENNVNGLAYLGAGILIFLIGLRGLGIIGKDNQLPIVISLEIEFTVIATLGLLLFYKPEDSTRMNVNLEGALPTEELKTLASEVKTMREEITGDRTITLQITRKKN